MGRFLLLSSLAVYVLAQDPPSGVPNLNFDCAKIPAVCTNMCWGAICTQPSFGTKLTYDSYAGQGAGGEVDDTRRRNAGCLPRPNRCAPRPGENCDEYPFASTLNADDGGPVSRCVPEGENSSQGGIIGGYTRQCGLTCEFIITFGNPAAANVAYCMAASDKAGRCVNDRDPPIFKRFPDGSLRADDDFASTQRVATAQADQGNDWSLFLLASGMESMMPANTPINATVWNPKPRNENMMAEAESGRADWSQVEWDFEEDSVVAKLDWE